MSMFSMYVYMVIQMSNVYVCVHVYVYYVSSIMYHVPCIKFHVSRTMHMFMHAHACLYIPIMYVLRIDIHMYIAYIIYIHILTYIIVAKIKAHVLPLPFWHSSECRMIVQKSFQPINVIAQLISTQCIQICNENKC